MARVKVYLPDRLAEQARQADLNLSAITQEVLSRRLAVLGFEAWLDRLADLDSVPVLAERSRAALDEAREDLGS